jgi:DNA-binding MarR family transcriptional regulator
MRINKNELRSILEFDQHLTGANGIQLLTPEGRVLLWLALDGSMSVSGAQLIAGTSHSSYYTVLRRLKDAGLITAMPDEKDGRIKWLRVKQEQK